MEKKPTVELKLPILKNMELVATQTADVVSKHMQLSEEKSGEISMALIEACINAFEHSESKSEVYIHFIIAHVRNQTTSKHCPPRLALLLVLSSALHLPK